MYCSIDWQYFFSEIKRTASYFIHIHIIYNIDMQEISSYFYLVKVLLVNTPILQYFGVLLESTTREYYSRVLLEYYFSVLRSIQNAGTLLLKYSGVLLNTRVVLELFSTLLLEQSILPILRYSTRVPILSTRAYL